MAKIKVNDLELYYDEKGSGEPLLLIAGLGYASWSWFRQVDQFAQRYRTIVFDNRGVGESDKPDIPYSIEMLAKDTVGLLDALGVTKAHILGVSMGGFIAQEIALSRPEVVKSLVLGCTSFGGPNSIPLTEPALNSILNVQGLNLQEAIRQGFRVALGRPFLDGCLDMVEQLVAWRLAKPTPGFAWHRQFSAGAAFNSESKLVQIKAPVLVITGSEDMIVPPENSQLLARRISGARLEIMPGCGHLLFIESPGEFNRRVLEFLNKVDQTYSS